MPHSATARDSDQISNDKTDTLPSVADASRARVREAFSGFTYPPNARFGPDPEPTSGDTGASDTGATATDADAPATEAGDAGSTGDPGSNDAALEARLSEAEELVASLTGRGTGNPASPTNPVQATDNKTASDFKVPWTPDQANAWLEESPAAKPILASLESHLKAMHDRFSGIDKTFGEKLSPIEKTAEEWRAHQQAAQVNAERHFTNKWFDEQAKNKGYADFFGTSPDSATSRQQRGRETVTALARQFYSAIEDREKPATPSKVEAAQRKAMQLASDYVLDRRGAVAEVRSEVAKRSKTVTQPGGYGKPGGTPKATNPREAAIRHFADGYAQIQRDRQ